MKEGKTLLLTTHFMEESDALSDRTIIIANGIIKVDGTSTKLKEQYGSGYKLIINKETTFSTNEIVNQLSQYLPKLTIESDISNGDVVFRTNQQPSEDFIQGLRVLESMKKENSIRNYGVQNSTMDDVFAKITNEAKTGEEIQVNIETLGLSFRFKFSDQ
jgi:ABC-type multidrug transport system ATPase subunit